MDGARFGKITLIRLRKLTAFLCAKTIDPTYRVIVILDRTISPDPTKSIQYKVQSVDLSSALRSTKADLRKRYFISYDLQIHLFYINNS